MPVQRDRTTHVISTAQELRALRTPLRQEIMHTVQRLGPCSAKEIAEDLGRAPASLYYHLQRLDEAGLIHVTGERPSGARLERVYQVTAARIIIDREKRSAAFLSALRDLYTATLRSAERELVRALDREKSKKKGTRAATGVLRLEARLSPEAVSLLPEKLQELLETLGEDKDPDLGDSYSVTTAVALLSKK